MPTLHRHLLPWTLCFALGCEAAPDPVPPADIVAETADACGEPVTAKCSVGGVVDCSLALYDVALRAYAGPAVMTPRAYCQSLCDAGAEAKLNVDMIIDQPGCGHHTRIQGLTCADCCKLADHPMPVFCDGDPCTWDTCEGDACTHTPWGWIGQDCSVGDCQGKYACDKDKCVACPSGDSMKVCAPCEGDAP